MSEALDRRGFLAAGAASGIALVAGCSGGDAVANTAHAARRAAGARARLRAARVPRTLEQAMRGPVIERGASGFAAASHVYNERFDYLVPRAVARP